jgi:hypothetical protein
MRSAPQKRMPPVRGRHLRTVSTTSTASNDTAATEADTFIVAALEIQNHIITTADPRDIVELGLHVSTLLGRARECLRRCA